MASAAAASACRCLMARASVLIDGVQLTGQSSKSGIGTYVRELVNGLVGIGDLEVSVLATADATLPDGASRATIRRHWRQGRRSEWEHELIRRGRCCSTARRCDTRPTRMSRRYRRLLGSRPFSTRRPSWSPTRLCATSVSGCFASDPDWPEPLP